MERHVSDTRTMHSKIYYVHSPQPGRKLSLDTLRLASGGCPVLYNGKNQRRTNIHR